MGSEQLTNDELVAELIRRGGILPVAQKMPAPPSNVYELVAMMAAARPSSSIVAAYKIELDPGETGNIVTPNPTGMTEMATTLVEDGDRCIYWGYFIDAEAGDEHIAVPQHYLIPGQILRVSERRVIKYAYSNSLYQNTDLVNPAYYNIYAYKIDMPHKEWGDLWQPIYEAIPVKQLEVARAWILR